MKPRCYIGLDVHQRAISYCVKDGSGKVHSQGKIPATHYDLDRKMKRLPQPSSTATEATMFSGWIYDHLKPHAAALKVAHPLMLRAIAAAKKKNDRIDTNKIRHCLRCSCYHRPANSGLRSHKPWRSFLPGPGLTCSFRLAMEVMITARAPSAKSESQVPILIASGKEIS